MKDWITKEDLMALLESSQYNSLANKYKLWSKLDKSDEDKLTLLGKVAVDQKYDKEFPSSENYWSPTYPIALEYYPYHGCEIYTDTKDYFFVYQEFGGHIPEKRCRCIRKELIVN